MLGSVFCVPFSGHPVCKKLVSLFPESFVPVKYKKVEEQMKQNVEVEVANI